MGVPLDMIENRTFDEMKLGDSASLVRTLSREDIELFVIMLGDVNREKSARRLCLITCIPPSARPK
jgi:DUF1009 family protein